MIKFKVKPFRNEKIHFNVKIFDSKEEMYGDRKSAGVNIEGFGDFDAMTTTFVAYRKRNGKLKKMNVIGDIVFNKKDLGVGAVSHEMNHASNHIHRIKLDENEHSMNFRKKNKLWLAMDESISWSTGYMTNQFFRKYNGKIYRNEVY